MNSFIRWGRKTCVALFYSAVAVLFFRAQFVYAIDYTVYSNKKGLDGNLSSTVDKIVFLGLWFAGAFAVLFFIYGAIGYITAGGDENKSATARRTMINAVIGIILATLTYVILRVAANTGHLISTGASEVLKNP